MTSSRITIPLLVTVLLLATTSAFGQPLPTNLVVLAVSDFETDADGWTATNTANGSELITYKAGGATSNSVGFIGADEVTEDNHITFIVAPPKFLGDRRAAYNGWLTFWFRQNRTGNLNNGNRFVVLGNTTNFLSFDLPVVPGTNWVQYFLPLNENAGWHFATRPVSDGDTSTSNQLATQADFTNVLGNLDLLRLKGEFSGNNGDQVDIDDVQLLGQPSDAPQPQLGINTYAGLLIQGSIGSRYAIEYRNVLDSSTNWLQLTNIILPVSPYFFTDTNSPTASSRFYRAVLVP